MLVQDGRQHCGDRPGCHGLVIAMLVHLHGLFLVGLGGGEGESRLMKTAGHPYLLKALRMILM